MEHVTFPVVIEFCDGRGITYHDDDTLASDFGADMTFFLVDCLAQVFQDSRAQIIYKEFMS